MYKVALRDEAVYREVEEKCRSLGFILNASHDQKATLLGYIRSVAVAAKKLVWSKKKPFLDKFYEWRVTNVSAEATQNLQNLQSQAEELHATIARLEKELQGKEREIVEQKTNMEKLKHRPSSYSIKRSHQASPYSKAQRTRMRKKVNTISEQYALASPSNSDVENVSPANACRMVDSAGLSMRQYMEVTKHIPQAPKLHKIKEERKR